MAARSSTAPVEAQVSAPGAPSSRPPRASGTAATTCTGVLWTHLYGTQGTAVGSYQLDLVMPGSSPLWASWRNLMRDKATFLT